MIFIVLKKPFNRYTAFKFIKTISSKVCR